MYLHEMSVLATTPASLALLFTFHGGWLFWVGFLKVLQPPD